jgi:hypothetical protein
MASSLLLKINKRKGSREVHAGKNLLLLKKGVHHEKQNNQDPGYADESSDVL